MTMKAISHRAFTLLEILVVLAIIGLLVGVLVTNTDKVFGRSQGAIAGIFVQETVKIPLVSYRRDVGDYPTSAEGLQALLAPPAAKSERWQGPYLEAKGGKLPLDPWGEPYVYRYPGTRNPGGYDIFSKGADHLPDTPDDIGNW